jgi:hypothetical protein
MLVEVDGSRGQRVVRARWSEVTIIARTSAVYWQVPKPLIARPAPYAHGFQTAADSLNGDMAYLDWHDEWRVDDYA